MLAEQSLHLVHTLTVRCIAPCSVGLIFLDEFDVGNTKSHRFDTGLSEAAFRTWTVGFRVERGKSSRVVSKPYVWWMFLVASPSKTDLLLAKKQSNESLRSWVGFMVTETWLIDDGNEKTYRSTEHIFGRIMNKCCQVFHIHINVGHVERRARKTFFKRLRLAKKQTR